MMQSHYMLKNLYKVKKPFQLLHGSDWTNSKYYLSINRPSKTAQTKKCLKNLAITSSLESILCSISLISKSACSVEALFFVNSRSTSCRHFGRLRLRTCLQDSFILCKSMIQEIRYEYLPKGFKGFNGIH